jgi:nitric oxide reductase subunit C
VAVLSKSQARLFFLVATLGFSGVFLFLTVDTIRQVPERSNEAMMTAQVVHGKEIWERNNCMGCHTLLGEGAYYAPELTKVVDRRGEAWMRVFLRDPEAMFPGQRKMPNYNFTEDEISAVIAFFAWIGGIDTNGFPPDPDLAPQQATPAADVVQAQRADRPKMIDTVCVACHSIGGKGGAVGPSLDRVGERFTTAEMTQWLADPQQVRPGTAMPNLGLDPAQIDELTTWLMADASGVAP